jgi:uncharacterized protein
MLITFRVSNFLSFNDEAELSMQAGQQRNLPSHYISTGSGRNDVNILKTAVIYGANASGKSNLIKAMDFAKKVIVNGIKSETTFNKHFRLDSANGEKPSSFEFEFKLDEKMYAYGFSAHLESKKIKEEWLVELGKTSENVIYERKVLEDGTSEFTTFNLKFANKKATTRFDVYKEDILDSQLFLTELSLKNLDNIDEAEVFDDAFHWLEVHLIIMPLPETSLFDFGSWTVGINAETDYAKYFKLFNLGISQIITKELSKEVIESLIKKHHLKELFERLYAVKHEGDFIFPFVFQLDGQTRRFAFFKKGKSDAKVIELIAQTSSENGMIEFEMSELSFGTQRILDLLPVLTASEQLNYTILIDEIDRSLHPELSRKFIEAFLTLTEGIESQLIVSTHESSLLDLNLLRRDEIWFTEKDTNGATKLYSLEEFKPRHDTELRKAYLTGRFGAIPFISNIKSLGWLKDKPLETAPSV